jgi:ABC-2 type transport system ATP-binding protein
MAAGGNVVHTEGLTRFYGKRRGILDVSLDVQQGEVFGYLGPNGAGKTTTIRVLLNFIRPSQGRAELFGLDVTRHSVETKRRIGYLPGELSLYDNLTGADFLRHLGHLRGGVDWAYVEQLASRLECELAPRIRTLSHGNRQKLGLIQAFMNKPDLLILDEPTIGLDPLMQQEFYHLIGEVKQDGRTVFLSSHVMPEVERVCDRVGIVREGSLIAVEDIDRLKARAVRRMEIRFAGPVPLERFDGVDGVRDVSIDDGVLSCTVVGDLDALVKAAAESKVVSIISHEPSLEEVFLTFYNQGEHDAQ